MMAKWVVTDEDHAACDYQHGWAEDTPLPPPAPPDGLYVVRFGVATAVTAKGLAEIAVTMDGHNWANLCESEQQKEIADAQDGIDRLQSALAALTQAQGGAE